MKVLALTPQAADVSPGQRFRIEQWQRHLEDQGVEIVYSPFVNDELGAILYRPGRMMSKARHAATAFYRQLANVRHIHRYDLVYVFREAALVGPALIESLIASKGVPVVFDFDDAVFVPYRSPSNGCWSYLKFPGKTGTLCRVARHVMAGNAYLADYASRYNQRVTVVPTTIDTDVYRPERRRRNPNGIVTIGWTGSHSTAQHLRGIVPALVDLAKRRTFRFVVVGAEAPEIPGATVEARPWCAESEVEDLSDIDIGVMPLPDDDWSRGKCGLKALQYMALGIPPVVSPVGVNTKIVRDGENGIVAGDDVAWVQGLQELMERHDYRQALGEHARRTVVERYSAKVVAPQVYDLFREAATGT